MLCPISIKFEYMYFKRDTYHFMIVHPLQSVKIDMFSILIRHASFSLDLHKLRGRIFLSALNYQVLLCIFTSLTAHNWHRIGLVYRGHVGGEKSSRLTRLFCITIQKGLSENHWVHICLYLENRGANPSFGTNVVPAIIELSQK